MSTPPSNTLSRSSSSLKSIDNDHLDSSSLATQIEHLERRLTPILGNPAQDPDVKKRPKPSGSLAMRKGAINLPISSTKPAVDLTSEETRAKYQEIIQNSGLFYINGERQLIEQKDIVKIGPLGVGSCGEVFKMEHKPSKMTLAMKVMSRTASDEDNKRIIMDLDVLVKSHNFPHIVRCIGYFIRQTEVWIGMELMACCFDKLLKLIKQPIPEPILGKLTYSTVTALNYLKEKQGVMHRDVKPSNILIDEHGNIKLCDFGISGVLVESKAKSRKAGCAAYMAPERINSSMADKPNYDTRADIWSLGITLIELATNAHPYANCQTDFDVMSRIVTEDPPELPADLSFSDDFRSFVNNCLIKDYQQRPKYGPLMSHPFFIQSTEQPVDVAEWYRVVSAKACQKRAQ
ncbi:unnamed protein product [Adineta ricciae]|uniref:mitogen-activated protein kinase kinase n=1 Tax=Adineta ricciae TaxID=249248 RepID=A0A813SYE3_ADIRI|nr:unnamed protein product [Adineta ricciae]CAF1503044.1 unnamed protein product [Adineta ricciae]